MIPRYSPTYTYRDLIQSYRDSFSDSIQIELEEKLKKLYGKRHVILFYDGKTAMTVLVKSMMQNGTVLTPAYNCIAVPQAIQRAGFTPRFVDVRQGRMDVDPWDFQHAIESNTRLLLPVHLFGIPWWIDELYELCTNTHIPIVEDTAAALGARRNGRLVGIRGDALVISFHWTKSLSGETGGGILTDDDSTAARIRASTGEKQIPHDRMFLFFKTWLRKSICMPCVFSFARAAHRLLFGVKMFEVVENKTDNDKPVYYGMSPFSCALVLKQLTHLDEFCSQRRRIADIYRQALQENPFFTLPVVPDGSEPSWTQFPVLINQKRGFFQHMQRHGIDVTWTYRYSCPDTYHMQGFGKSRQVAHQIIGLPTSPGLRLEVVNRIGQVAASYSAA